MALGEADNEACCVWQGEQPHCGFPEKNYHQNAERLARAGLKVVVVEQTETPAQLSIRNEERKANKQNQVTLPTGLHLVGPSACRPALGSNVSSESTFVLRCPQEASVRVVTVENVALYGCSCSMIDKCQEAGMGAMQQTY